MTAKIRVYELAKELNIDNKVAMTKLKAMGFEVASHQSTLSLEQAEKLRADIKGAVAPSAAKPTAAGAPKVVLRRRKAEEPAAETAPAEQVAEQAAPVQEAPAVVPQAPQVVAERDTKSSAETRDSGATAASPSPVVSSVEPAAEVSASSLHGATRQEVVSRSSTSSSPAPTTTTQTPPSGEASATGSAATGAAAAEVRRRQIAGGATIVRRATPEEIEASRQAQESSRRTIRKEDSRGTRVTGLGLLSERTPSSGPYAPGAMGGFDESAPDDVFAARRRDGTKDRSRLTAEEEEAAAAAAKLKKARRTGAGLHLRALLNQIDDGSEGEEIPDGESSAESSSAPQQVRTTVYTPSAPRGRREAKRRKDLRKTQITTPRAAYRVVKMSDQIQVGDLARQMSVKAADIIKKLMAQGMMATITQSLDVDTATLLAQEFGFGIESTVKTIEDILGDAGRKEAATGMKSRPPIVTVMGHVDHGKTSILDAIREANVAAGEAGGITQHIGAYTAERNGKKIAFLDTPGHEAFSAMRARGAKLTDIVVLVVAADDGVMPQTVEAVSHAKAANVPLIVAINKIDKPTKNLDRVYSELTEHGVQSEEWGGDTQFVKVSALQKIGINELLEAILLQSEVLELKATEEGKASGTVIEAHLDKGRGPVATVMVTSGTLRAGDFIVAGTKMGRVRAMHDHLGRSVEFATPATPVEIIGLSGVPEAGDRMDAVEDERTAREASEWRIDQDLKRGGVKSSAASLSDLLGKIQSDEQAEVALIIKADTQGSIEAVCESVQKLSTPRVSNRIIHRGVGGVTESDITLAAASKAVVIGFNVRAVRGLDEHAEQLGVPLKYFSIIYELVDAVKAVMAGKLPPIVKEVVIGHAEVRQAISVPKIGTIAGSFVLDGKIMRGSLVRLLRDSIVIYSGKLGSLRRFKDDVREVQTGYECGIGIEGYNDIKVGDVVEVYTLEESAATL